MDRILNWISSLFDVPLMPSYSKETQLYGDDLVNEYKTKQEPFRKIL